MSYSQNQLSAVSHNKISQILIHMSHFTPGLLSKGNVGSDTSPPIHDLLDKWPRKRTIGCLKKGKSAKKKSTTKDNTWDNLCTVFTDCSLASARRYHFSFQHKPPDANHFLVAAAIYVVALFQLRLLRLMLPIRCFSGLVTTPVPTRIPVPSVADSERVWVR
jgi:hypothetical protein